MSDLQTVIVPVFVRYQRVRHVSDGTLGVFRRYHPFQAGWVIVRVPSGYGTPGDYDLVTPGAEWESVDQRPRSEYNRSN